MNIGIIGLGYVGAPLAYLSAFNGYDVIGIDNNCEVIDKINKRANIPIELKKELDMCENINLIASNDYSLLINTEVIIVCVPTPTKNNIPDLTIMKNVINSMSHFIKKGCLIVIESTIAPGMTKKYVEENLYKVAGIKVNQDYDLAYCPERIDPGNKKFWVGNINRVCGASSTYALNKTCDFYRKIIKADIIPMGSIEEAELVKVWENSMRNIRIAQANLLAMICDKYNFKVNRIINGLNSKVEQFGISLAYPGIGPGGHCIPEDIHYLIESVEENTNVKMNLLKESVNINEHMPEYVYNKLVETIKMNGDSIDTMKIMVLGISYKANSTDTRRSQAIALYDIINKNYKNNVVFDPIAKCNIINTISEESFEKEINTVEVIVIACPHNLFLDIDYTKYKNIKYILDCWNKLDSKAIIDSGINYIGVGI